MGLTVGGRELAVLRVQGVSLRPTIGGYDFVVSLQLTINADNESHEAPRRATVIGAQIEVRTGSDESKRLGFARPEERFEVVPTTYTLHDSRILHLHLHPGQLSALEELRGASDLTFDLSVVGTVVGGRNDGRQVQDRVNAHVPRSQWIDTLSGAGARDIVLLEVPLPLAGPPDDSDEVRSALVRAESQFRAGDYNGCVGSCRTVIQEAGQLGHGESNWAPKALDKLGDGRTGMSKSERESALWATLRHYAHLAHHGTGEGGVADFTRADAQFVLRLTVSAVAHAEATLHRQALLPKD